jgi:isopentenyl-diphosphate Delta-isomerase
MVKVTPQPTTESRKVDHIRINLDENVQFPNTTTGLEKYRFLHQAVPEIDLADINTETTVFGKSLSAPLLISSMTGGTEMAQTINTNLARVAQSHRIAMGVGSQRAALEDDLLAESFKLRHFAPDVLFFANIGAVQLNYGYTVDHCRRAVDMIEADALILHFNVLQEAVQPEGDTRWAGVLAQVERVAAQLEVPIIAKEVGWGFAQETVRRLIDAGVSAIDVAGAGGTSWSEVEYHRAPTSFHAQVAAAFADWGIPTADAIRYAAEAAPDHVIIASGGLRDGIDIAKCVALGAQLGGMAGPFLRAAVESVEAVENFTEVVTAQLRIAMLCSGVRTISELQSIPLCQVD